VLNLPSVAECYKTYDDINLVKSGDIGQVLVVGEITHEEARTGITRDGVTPPMRNAKERVFRKPIPVAPETVKSVEDQLLKILHVSWQPQAALCLCLCLGGSDLLSNRCRLHYKACG